jgi:hypothetical protein
MPKKDRQRIGQLIWEGLDHVFHEMHDRYPVPEVAKEMLKIMIGLTATCAEAAGLPGDKLIEAVKIQVGLDEEAARQKRLDKHSGH